MDAETSTTTILDITCSDVLSDQQSVSDVLDLTSMHLETDIWYDDALNINKCNDNDDDINNDDDNNKDDDDDDDDDDSINVIINKNVADSYDVELNNEIDQLIAMSINVNSDQFITICIRNSYILVPLHIPLSPQLKDRIWSMELMASNIPYAFKNKTLFEKELQSMPLSMKSNDVVGFFGARYNKPMSMIPTTSRHSYNGQTSNQTSTSNKYHVYFDFALIIVQSGRILDSAIHAQHGNINALVEKYQPRKVYYNASVGEPLDMFMNYPSQMFYHVLNKIMVPMPIQTTCNVLPFCDDNDVYCAHCRALQTCMGYYSKHEAKVPNFLQQIYSSDSIPIRDWLPLSQKFYRKMKQYNVRPQHSRRDSRPVGIVKPRIHFKHHIYNKNLRKY